MVTPEHFVEALELPPAPPDFGLESAVPYPDFAAKAGSAVAIGGQLAGFDGAIDPKSRQWLSNALLLAQLAADKATEQNADGGTERWFEHYTAVLEKIGFVLSDKKDVQLNNSGQSIEVRDVLIRQLADALGQAASLASHIIEILKNLTTESTKNPWYQLFDRQVRQQSADVFQLSDVQMTDGALTLTAVAVEVETRSTALRVALIGGETHAHDVLGRMRRYTVNQDLLNSVSPSISEKLGTRIAAYVAEIEI